MVQTMMGRDCLPVFSTTVKSRPNPKSTTAHCSTFFGGKFNAGRHPSLVFQGNGDQHAQKDGNDRPADNGKKVPKIQAGTAMARHRAIPRLLVLKNSITGSFLSFF